MYICRLCYYRVHNAHYPDLTFVPPAAVSCWEALVFSSLSLAMLPHQYVPPGEPIVKQFPLSFGIIMYKKHSDNYIHTSVYSLTLVNTLTSIQDTLCLQCSWFKYTEYIMRSWCCTWYIHVHVYKFQTHMYTHVLPADSSTWMNYSWLTQP